MDTITLLRSGDAPLKFAGDKIAEAGGRTSRSENRWHSVAVYRDRDTSQYIAHLRYQSQWDNEREYHAAAVCREPSEVASFFRGYDPLSRFVGPPEDHPKRRLIEAEVRSQYEEAVSAVLGRDEFTERPQRDQLADYAALDMQAVDAFVRTQLAAAFPVSRAEACALCEANNGSMLLPDHYWMGLAANIEDTPASSLSEKWECDASALAARIFAADRGTQFALAWAVAQFWRRCELDTDEALRLAGFSIAGGNQ